MFIIRVADDRGEWTLARRFRHFESLHRSMRWAPSRHPAPAHTSGCRPLNADPGLTVLGVCRVIPLKLGRLVFGGPLNCLMSSASETTWISLPVHIGLIGSQEASAYP